MTTEEKLLHFQETALTDARRQSARILNDYRSGLEETFRRHQQEALKKADLRLRTETDRLKRESNKELSLKKLEIRRHVSQKQKELSDRIFEELSQRLLHFRASEAYLPFLENQIKKILSFAGEEKAVFRLDPEDARFLPVLSSSFSAPIQISPSAFGGGIQAFLPGPRILIDESFSSRTAELREQFILEGGAENEP